MPSFVHLTKKAGMDFNIKLSNGFILRGFINSPGERMKAMIIMVHGLGEHIRRYSGWSGLFSEAMMGMAGVDLPGHGLSDGKRGHIRNYSLNITAPIGRIPPTVRVFFTSPSTGPVREGKPAKASRAKPNITAPPPSSPNLPETATQQPRIRYTLGTNIPPVPNTGGFVCSGRLHKIFY